MTGANITDFLNSLNVMGIFIFIIRYLLSLVFTVIGFLILTKIIIKLHHRLSIGYLLRVSKKRQDTIITLVDNLIKYVVGIIATFAFLIALGINKTSLIAGAGAISIIIGIAGQELISDFINGFFTVVEGYYDVGDYISINSHKGVVEKLGIKATVLRTDKGEVITIPNSLIEEIINYNKGEHHLFLVLSAAYEEKVERVEEVIKTQVIPRVVNQTSATAGEYIGICKLNTSSVDYQVKISCPPNDRFQVERDVYTEAKKVFDEMDIEIPYTKISLVDEK